MATTIRIVKFAIRFSTTINSTTRTIGLDQSTQTPSKITHKYTDNCTSQCSSNLPNYKHAYGSKEKPSKDQRLIFVVNCAKMAVCIVSMVEILCEDLSNERDRESQA